MNTVLTVIATAIIGAVLTGLAWLAFAGFFDAEARRGPQPCPIVWRADCEPAR